MSQVQTISEAVCISLCTDHNGLNWTFGLENYKFVKKYDKSCNGYIFISPDFHQVYIYDPYICWKEFNIY